jgi:uncharacterized repeat protein (TIGR01451 family)
MSLSLVLALAVAGLGIHALAFASGDVSVSLTAHRVAVSQGKEALVPAEQAKPGEVIEYRATYHNAGANVVRDLKAVLPVPAGLEYLPLSASPAVLEASLDGKRFEPVPLQRRVRMPDGRVELQDVPSVEYRYLRWSLGTLDPDASLAVKARMRVSPVEALAAAGH